MSTTSPILLAIETATSACSVALQVRGVIVEEYKVGSNIHSQVLLTMVRDVLQKGELKAANIDAVVVGQGPGSFTGLRIGVGVAQGLAYGVGCPMIGLSSLDALASQSTLDGRIFAGIDARMGEIYWCEYFKDGGLLSRRRELQVSAPATVRSAMADDYALVGNAWAQYRDSFGGDFPGCGRHLQDIVFPSAAALLILSRPKYAAAEWASATDFVPEYVRNNVARKSKKTKAIKKSNKR